MEKHYFMQLTFSDKDEYQIVESDNRYRDREIEKVVFRRDYIEGEELGEYLWPADVRQKFEELTGKPEFSDTEGRPFNIVPALLADEDEVVYDCPCAWAQRVKGHAVYCENEGWLYSPRKCRRGPGSWDGTPRQEDCPGFRRNENVPE